jgi:hypothetical protein
MTDENKDPEERAFTGHSDHPPSEPDQTAEGNQDLLREGGDSTEPPKGEPQEGESPGDQGTNLPGYG